MIDLISFIIFIGGIVVYYTTYNAIFLTLAIIAVIVMHSLHQQEIIDAKNELANDIIHFFKRNDKNE